MSKSSTRIFLTWIHILVFGMLIQPQAHAKVWELPIDGITYYADYDTGTAGVGRCDKKKKGSALIPAVIYSQEYDWENDVYITCKFDVTSVYAHAFDGCSALNTIALPNSVSSIGYCAFRGCASLETFTFPIAVATVENGLFDGCTSLKKVNFPKIIFSIDGSAFADCTSLTSLEIPATVTSIGHDAFYGSGLESIEIPNSVTSIGPSAFNECKALLSVKLPVSLHKIEYSLFEYCTALTSVNIPDGVTSIEDRAFFNCFALKTIEIPESVLTIGEEVFGNISKLRDLYVYASTHPKIYLNTFSIKLNNLTLHVPKGAVNEYKSAPGWKNLIDNVFAGIVGDLYPNAFREGGFSFNIAEGDGNNVELTPDSGLDFSGNITIPETVTHGGNTYSVTAIADGAFAGCENITGVTIPNSITAIGNSAFEDCPSLSALHIGTPPADDDADMQRMERKYANPSPGTIGNNAFKGCGKLADIYSYKTLPPVCKGLDSFDPANYTSTTLHVYADALPAYESADVWNEFAHVTGDLQNSGVSEAEISPIGIQIVNGEIINEAHAIISVYNIDGTMWYRGNDTRIGNLPAGIFIVEAAGKVIKLSIP